MIDYIMFFTGGGGGGDDISERSVRLFAKRFLGHTVFHQGKI